MGKNLQQLLCDFRFYWLSETFKREGGGLKSPEDYSPKQNYQIGSIEALLTPTTTSFFGLIPSYDRKPYLQKACDGGEMAGCVNLGVMHYDSYKSEQSKQDLDKAIKLYTQACEKGEALGCEKLGDFYKDDKKDEREAQGFYHKAITLYQKSCEKGDASSCFKLVVLPNNTGEKNENKEIELLKKSLILIQKSCDQGDTKSCGYLAFFHTLNPSDDEVYKFLVEIGFKPDPQKTVSIAQQVCDRGELMGCAVGAMLHQNIFPRFLQDFSFPEVSMSKFKPNEKKFQEFLAKGINILQKSCDSGDFLSCSLGIAIYQQDLWNLLIKQVIKENATQKNQVPINKYKIKQDDKKLQKFLTKEVDLLQKFCDAGDMFSCPILGGIYLLGTQSSQNKIQSKSNSQELINDNKIAEVFHKLDGNKTLQEMQKELASLRKSCKSGNLESCSILAFSYLIATGSLIGSDTPLPYSLPIKPDKEKALRLFGKSCDLGLAQVCEMLGFAYEANLPWIKKDEKKSLELYRKAITLYQESCEKGDAWGCESLAEMYANGKGVTKDEKKASEFYGKACEKGDQDSCQKVKSQGFWGWIKSLF